MAPASTLPSSGHSSRSRTGTVVGHYRLALFSKLTIIANARLTPPTNKVRYHHDQLDIHNAAGVLASQFDYKTLHLSVPQSSPHVYDDHLDLHPANHPHHHSYSQDYPISHRNHLGLDIPPHSYHSPCLPPPPIPVGGGGPTYHLPASHRRYSGDVARDHSYSTGGTPPVQIPPGSDQRSIVPKREPDLQPIIQSAASQQPQQPSQQPQQSAQQQTPSTSQNTRRETSNLVIACRQWWASPSQFVKTITHVSPKPSEEDPL